MRSYPDLDAAVAWLRDGLGCAVAGTTANGRAELTLGNGALIAVQWDAAAHPASGGRPPATLLVRVDDVDTAYARAVTHGATGVTPPVTMPDGERQAVVRDPAGHSWTLAGAGDRARPAAETTGP
jgi:uncharacterized glyoxalase superfamily protein PhnB